MVTVMSGQLGEVGQKLLVVGVIVT